uniref:Uncharacterized protein n=1 Tax=Tetranychus urticae TaxID=32264 RepID=T1KCX2_TETUR
MVRAQETALGALGGALTGAIGNEIDMVGDEIGMAGDEPLVFGEPEYS